jgi:hypothetical protein
MALKPELQDRYSANYENSTGRYNGAETITLT